MHTGSLWIQNHQIIETDSKEETPGGWAGPLTDRLSPGAEHVDVHGGENVGVHSALAPPRLLGAGVDGVGVPVGPEERRLEQRECEGVRKLVFNHHLPVKNNTALGQINHSLKKGRVRAGQNLWDPSRLERWMKLNLASAQ